MMITNYFQVMIELNNCLKLSSSPKAGWINSILILMYNDY